MESEHLEAKLAEAEAQATREAADRIERRRVDRLGWDELTVEQKLERMRAIVKGVDANSHEHWRRLEELGTQVRQHVHGLDGKSLMPLDIKLGGIGMQAEARMMPDGKVYF